MKEYSWETLTSREPSLVKNMLSYSLGPVIPDCCKLGVLVWLGGPHRFIQLNQVPSWWCSWWAMKILRQWGLLEKVGHWGWAFRGHGLAYSLLMFSVCGWRCELSFLLWPPAAMPPSTRYGFSSASGNQNKLSSLSSFWSWYLSQQRKVTKNTEYHPSPLDLEAAKHYLF